jgi:hypothetical protein
LERVNDWYIGYAQILVKSSTPKKLTNNDLGENELIMKSFLFYSRLLQCNCFPAITAYRFQFVASKRHYPEK